MGQEPDANLLSEVSKALDWQSLLFVMKRQYLTTVANLVSEEEYSSFPAIYQD